MTDRLAESRVRRICARCRERLPFSSYGPKGGKSHAGRLSSYCRPCKAEMVAEWREAAKEVDPHFHEKERERARRRREKARKTKKRARREMRREMKQRMEQETEQETER